METFAKRLAQAIERSGLSRPVFAARAGVGTSALAKWLAGKLTPKSDQLLSLAQVAGTTMEWLLTGNGAVGPAGAAPSDSGTLKHVQAEVSRLALHLCAAEESLVRVRELLGKAASVDEPEKTRERLQMDLAAKKRELEEIQGRLGRPEVQDQVMEVKSRRERLKLVRGIHEVMKPMDGDG